ncbi:VanZ family protein [Cellulomonas fimi]|uniref:VanZ family protein n=1 Tax=Cellulomonas fimi (strain ATCC 484 / DSM 20113 / JCM 1341 / CCUG 24087 / LMG 16345 / NBRC 15513 / NCIMB 8980 / NCTC 7547 / NRS-133) TaxID=590998 RepID=F4GZS6_CELFA|nr:VanZ family protein [Cellulomonas fimi]AEE47242.1 VanZ family protein [Cellulomonas fimi ATCC 484]NNH06957.1 VanZ family protein [Cellulomonas fimi]VEH35696.1 VanZ like family [Cellulomonas fimi]
MIATLLVEHAWAVPLAALLVVVGCLVLGGLLLRAGERGRRLLRAVAVVAALPVPLLTLLPDDARAQSFCAVQLAWPSLGGVETLANITLLLPAAYVVTLLVGRPVLVALGASAVSVVIELVQALAPTLGRACDTTDWEMNTIGAVLGAILAAATLAAVRRRPRARRTGEVVGADASPS